MEAPSGVVPSATTGHPTAASFTMKKAYLILSLLAVALLPGCGGPKYATGFKEWLAIYLAKQSPTKLAWVKTEELSSGKTQAVFKFTSELQMTENLYGPATPVDTAPATAALQKMREANVPIDQQNEVIKIYNSITILSLFKITTPEGKKIPMSGKAQATLQNNGEWDYELLDVVGGTYLGGKEPTGKWALEGSKEAKENAAAVQEKVGEVVAAADKAIQGARENQIREDKFTALVQKKEAEAAKAQEDAFLAFCDQGQVIYGKWVAEEGSGNIGIRWGERTKVGDGYSITGVFFDPDNQNYQKPFDGSITKSNEAGSPYELELRFVQGNGVHITDSLWNSVRGATSRQEARDAGLNTKTVGLLLEPLRFKVILAYHPNGELLGVAKDDGPQAIYEPKFQLGKSYVPKKAEGIKSSSLSPIPTETGGEPVAVGSGQANSGSPLVADQGGLPQAPQGGAISNQQMQAADAELNSTYQTLRAKMNSTQKERFKAIQREWVQQRDAAMAANPMNATAINYQATVERTAQLKSMIPGGQQSLPSGSQNDGKYRMSVEEIASQMAASKPLADAYGAAMKSRDLQAGQKYLAELIAKYPQCPMTLFLQMGDAFMARDIAKGQKLYTILMTEYPDFQGMRAAYKANYERFMQLSSR